MESNFKDRLILGMKERGLKAVDLVKLTGLSKSQLSHYMTGRYEAKQIALHKLAVALNVSEAWLMGYDVPMERAPSDNECTEEDLKAVGLMSVPKMRTVPILGSIACGEPTLSDEFFDGTAQIPEDIRADFALRCKGDSMIDFRILDGDIVYVKKQSTVENGEIAVVLVEGEATLKRFYFDGKAVTLVAGNSAYRPFVYSGSTLNEIHVLGKAVGFTSAKV